MPSNISPGDVFALLTGAPTSVACETDDAPAGHSASQRAIVWSKCPRCEQRDIGLISTIIPTTGHYGTLCQWCLQADIEAAKDLIANVT